MVTPRAGSSNPVSRIPTRTCHSPLRPPISASASGSQLGIRGILIPELLILAPVAAGSVRRATQGRPRGAGFSTHVGNLPGSFIGHAIPSAFHGTTLVDNLFQLLQMHVNPRCAGCLGNAASDCRRRPGWARSSAGKPRRLCGSRPQSEGAAALAHCQRRENNWGSESGRFRWRSFAAKRHTNHPGPLDSAALPLRGGSARLRLLRAALQESSHQGEGHSVPLP